MEPRYEIVVNICVPEGYTESGRFTLTGDHEAAMDIFGRLNGGDGPSSSTAIRFDLLEINDTLSTVIQTRYSILCEASENCKIILKETFRLLTFRPAKIY
jgi:hypothetical protein